MPEIRTDSLTGRTVIVAENRALRPNEFAALPRDADPLPSGGIPAVAATVSSCPFCVGNESRTPQSVYEQCDSDGRWQVRVVPNMFPAVAADNPAVEDRPGIDAARGAHEVIIECAQHRERMTELSVPSLQLVLDAYVNRLRYWREDGRYSYGLIFKNQGPRAGASIAHLHSQLIVLPYIPPAVAGELDRAERHFLRHRECAYCRMVGSECSRGERLVLNRDGFVAFCPATSIQPYEVWLFPKQHQPSFERTDSELRQRLVEVLHTLFERLEQSVPQATYNLLLRTSPWRGDHDHSYHWRMELIPRVNALAGFEIATGVHINPLAPEEAARQLQPTWIFPGRRPKF